MRHWSARGQVEPLAALAVVLAVSAAIVVYVGALDDAIPARPEPETPQTIQHRIERNLSTAGAVDAETLDAALATVPDGWRANVTLVSGDSRWDAGPAPPGDGQRVRRRVSVALGPERIRPGQLRVVVWR